MSRAPAAMLLSMRSDTASGREYPVALRDSMRATGTGCYQIKVGWHSPRVLAFPDRRCSSLKQPRGEQQILDPLPQGPP